jgi:hypothetical protein
MNLIMVGFEMAEDGSSTDEDSEAVPRLRSVRFQGRHLLDSQVACELLTHGQRLAQVSAMVRFRIGHDSDVIVPTTLRLEKDNISVQTGFGMTPDVARRIHNSVVSGVHRSLTHGLSDLRRLVALAADMEERASRSEPPERATFFAPSQP